MEKIYATTALYTRPRWAPKEYGLFSVITVAPYFVGREIVTHKRAARSYSSARPMSLARHMSLGHWTPTRFKEQGDWMSAGRELPEDLQVELRNDWDTLEADIRARIELINEKVKKAGFSKGLAKEQINRLLPTSKMERGIVTATYSAWQAIFKLRCSPAADGAMQELAYLIRNQLEAATPVASDFHVPFADELVTTKEQYAEACMTVPARIARVSTGKPGVGQRSDEELVSDLLRDAHMSPFEHLAEWTHNPHLSAFTSKKEDLQKQSLTYGWQNFRSVVEHRLAGE